MRTEFCKKQQPFVKIWKNYAIAGVKKATNHDLMTGHLYNKELDESSSVNFF